MQLKTVNEKTQQPTVVAEWVQKCIAEHEKIWEDKRVCLDRLIANISADFDEASSRSCQHLQKTTSFLERSSAS